jgi:3-methylcrotonyl-CoA carboxylase alpha subunit
VAEVTYGPEGAELSVEGVAPAHDAFATPGPDAVYVLRRGRQTKVAMRDLALAEAGDQETSGTVRAPMHGKVIGLFVEKGARVARGQRLAIIEAMKMEHTVVAPLDGTVAEILVTTDAHIVEGAKIVVITPVVTS